MTQEAAVVAVVDDDADVRRSLGRLCCAAGFSVVMLDSGEALLRDLPTRAIDCVILDLHMPGMSGFEVQAVLRSRHAGLPVIVLTGHDSAESRRRCGLLGARSFLSKPVDADELVAAVAAAVSD